jgi:hypothetical protein
MKNQWILPVVCAALLLTCTKSPQQAGTMSETDTAMIYNPDNTPAVGAVVKFFEATDSTRTIAYQTLTDTKGRYSTKALAKGVYNLLAYSAKGLAKGANDLSTTNDSLIAYQDSIIVLTDTVLVQPDTLEKPGSITGTIGLQPNHDPRTATVQVLGTDLYSNVDKDGRFTLSPVAKGRYNLRLVTTLPDYTPTYVTISTQGQKRDTLTDTLWLTFTGIPVVTGLAAIYDTVNGLVHLFWNKADYRDFQNYLIFRDPYDSIVLSTTPFAACTDTLFADTVFKRSLAAGKFSFKDTNDYHFKYRVCIENNSTKRGDTYKYVGIVAASPLKAKMSFAVTFFHIAKKFITDSASINDSLLCCVNVSNPTRQLKSLVWTDVNTGKTVRTATLDSTKTTANDTLIYSWNSVGGKRLACLVTDMAGTLWRDTAYIAIVKDDPVVTLTYSPATVTNNDTVHLHISAFDKYGKIVNFECDIGNTGQFFPVKSDSAFDTIVVAPPMPNTEFLCTARATDDDGNVVTDPLSVTINMFKLATNSPGYGTRQGHSSVVFNNKMWLIGGCNYLEFYVPDAWYSEDGVSWLAATQQDSCLMRGGHTSLVFNNLLWIIGGGYAGAPSLMNDVWHSSDGKSWTQATSAAQFSPRSGHTSVLFNNEMWVIGGASNSANGTGIYRNDVWHSSDGVTWIQATANAAFPPRSYHSSVVFNNMIWIIGGIGQQGAGSSFYNDVWYSSDGIIWTQATASAGFSPRYCLSSTVFDNKIWVIAGEDSSNMRGDAWYSVDGVTWTQVDNTGFSPRFGHTSLVFDNRLWVIAGLSPADQGYLSYSDVWHSGSSAK